MTKRNLVGVRTRVLPLIAAISLVFLCGCSEAAGDSDYLDGSQINTEYQQAATALQLPPGIEFPKDMPGVETSGPTVYQAGLGVSRAQYYWMFAWETEWLEQRGVDEVRAATALDVLRIDVPSSWLMTEGADESTRQYYASLLAAAELGDPSGFQADVDANSPDLIRTGE